MSELPDIVDEDGEPTGETVDREIAHRDGVRHRTSHVWLVRVGPAGLFVEPPGKEREPNG